MGRKWKMMSNSRITTCTRKCTSNQSQKANRTDCNNYAGQGKRPKKGSKDSESIQVIISQQESNYNPFQNTHFHVGSLGQEWMGAIITDPSMIKRATAYPLQYRHIPHKFMQEERRKEEERIREFERRKYEQRCREEQRLRDEEYRKEQERHREELHSMEKQRLLKEQNRKLQEAKMMEMEMANQFRWLQQQNRDPLEAEIQRREQFVHLLKREGIRDEFIDLLIKQEVYSVETLHACSQEMLIQIGIPLGQVVLLKKIA